MKHRPGSPMGTFAPQGTDWAVSLILRAVERDYHRDAFVAIGHVIRYADHVENRAALLAEAARWARTLPGDMLAHAYQAGRNYSRVSSSMSLMDIEDETNSVNDEFTEFLREARDEVESLMTGVRFVRAATAADPWERPFPGTSRNRRRKAIKTAEGSWEALMDSHEAQAALDKELASYFSVDVTPTSERWAYVAATNPDAWWARRSIPHREGDTPWQGPGAAEWIAADFAAEAEYKREIAGTEYSASAACECESCISDDRHHCRRSSKRVA